jgi:hypothetical protein
MSSNKSVVIDDRYVTEFPSSQLALDIFKGEWLSEVPPADILVSGKANHFDDHRINWLMTQTQVAGKRVLELGPMECGHSYMLHNAGASEVVAIEGNTRNYFKCLVIKEIFELDRLKLLCGDIIAYLTGTDEKFDICVASGVLYHMREPGKMLEYSAKAAPRFLLWTHFFDKEAIQGRTTKFFAEEPTRATTLGFEYNMHPYNYDHALQNPNFCGGSAQFANWLEKDTILELLSRAGLTDIRVDRVDLEHVNGPCITLYACKPGIDDKPAVVPTTNDRALADRVKILSEQADSYKVKLLEAQGADGALRAEIEALREEVRRMSNSVSWRATQPLRSVRGLFNSKG